MFVGVSGELFRTRSGPFNVVKDSVNGLPHVLGFLPHLRGEC